MTRRIRVESDLAKFFFDIWGSTKALVTWKGQFYLLLLWTEIRSRRVDIDIMEMLGQDEIGLQRFFTIRF